MLKKPMIVKLALRNALRHGKSSLLILFFMITIGVIFMTGNSLLVTINQSMQKVFRENITADVMVMTDTEDTMSLFGASIPSIGEFFTLPILENPQELQESLEALEIVESTMPLLYGAAVMDSAGYRSAIPYFGIPSEEYADFFPLIEILQGDAAFTGHGVLLSKTLQIEWEQKSGHKLSPGDWITLSTAGDQGVRIRQVPLKGIYQYPYENPVIDRLVLLDGITAAELLEVLDSNLSDQSPEESSDLLSLDLDSLFDSETEEDFNDTGDILDSLDSLFDNPNIEETTQSSWHFLLIRFSQKLGYKKAMAQIEQELKGRPLQILNWRQAAGESASYAYFIQLFFYGGFILILVAGILGIINIMLISLYQRTVEIGTIQALGGDVRFIRRLLTWEYLALSIFAGLLSLIVSWIFFRILNSMEIQIGNSVINMVFGGKPFYFPFTFQLAIINMLLSVGVGWISSLFPVGQALALEPVEALKGVDR